MRTFFSILLLLALGTVGLTTSGCGSDDDAADGAAGTFTYEGTTYALSQGFVIDNGDDGDGIFGRSVLLLSDGFSLNASGDLTGRGDALTLFLYTQATEGLGTGTYTFNFNQEGADLSIDEFYAYTDVDVDLISGDAGEAETGSVTVSQNGEATTLTFDMVTTEGLPLTGSFTGVLPFIQD